MMTLYEAIFLLSVVGATAGMLWGQYRRGDLL